MAPWSMNQPLGPGKHQEVGDFTVDAILGEENQWLDIFPKDVFAWKISSGGVFVHLYFAGVFVLKIGTGLRGQDT